MVKIFKAQKRPSMVGQNLDLDIVGFDINGDGIARSGKKSVFVTGALPGEQVQAKIISEHSKYLRAKAIKVTNPHPQRITPRCKHYYQCGGCDFQHMPRELELEVKQQKIAELFRRNAELDELPWQAPLLSDEWHYRRKARIGVQYNRLNQPLVGFRQKNAKHITEIKSCDVLAPDLSNIFAKLQTLLSELKGHQLIGHVEVFATNAVTLVFRYLGKLSKDNRARFVAFAEQHSYQVLVEDDQQLHDLTEVQRNGQKSELYYDIDGCRINFTAKDFIQVNAELNAKMAMQAIDWLELTKADNVLDLFSGLGNFSLPIAKRVKQVVGIEGVQTMVDRASDNASANQMDNCQFYQADLNAEQFQWPWPEARTFNKVILDPARAGAHGVIKPVAELGADKVLYIACDAATMARDCKTLLASGYRLEKIALLDMFAQTRHVETMALFHKT
ncbi:23S rRNA (uracil(1939)-C(5))-methyltransferase RlmD [Thalassotalea mangrovi]|uniref:23S rRNA (uracil(1939)-C(5))-methyltransferase RlmD n=1 Tax=Thalassotalea mangrovi TaxID=2572245 RepID=A0A4U1B850_9GAMM|nr:23S rRNA (uracil(1939)-C(5))-methyltransferase RlmD [Thalassotalea mangrovi]TKB46172.1 23S rRNA (uracil(1939)-C(5))-methyltransferase RlmD [Thalassotalea mangrovi]